MVFTLGAMSPGPSLAVVLRNTISGGRKQGIATESDMELDLGYTLSQPPWDLPLHCLFTQGWRYYSSGEEL